MTENIIKIDNGLYLCSKCNIHLKKSSLKCHFRTNLHKKNCLLSSQFNNVNIIATAFRERITSYRINPTELSCDGLEQFISSNESTITELINLSLIKHRALKINFELFAYFMLPTSEEKQLKSFNTKFVAVFQNADLKDLYSKSREIFSQKMTEFQHCESGWSFISVSHLEVNINRYSPLRGGSSYLELPQAIRSTKSCLNIKNNDDHCFAWSIVAALFPCNKNANRTSSYPCYSSVLNVKGMNFPPSPNDIKLFEKNNANLSVTIYGLDNKNQITGPLYLTNQRKINHVNLLYFQEGSKGHYCLIKDLVKLTRRQISRHHGKPHFCENCLQFFVTKEKYDSHVCSKVLTVLPSENTKITFKNYERQQKINFVIYADFESLLLNHSAKTSKNTSQFKQHQPSCFGYYVCCSHDSSLNKYVSYRGEDCVKVFIDYLIRDVKYISNIINDKKPMTPLTEKEKELFNSASRCHICKQSLILDKVADHDHITGKFRGAAHSQCNLLYRVCPFIPVFFHNLSNYDCHLFIAELAKYPGDLKIIPKTKEKYLTITKYLKDVKNPSSSIQIKFLDSFQFLSCSLDNLSRNLTNEDLKHLSQEFKSKKQLKLLRQKGIYPYDYIDSWIKFDEKCLPQKSKFYNTLTESHITDEEYNRAQNIWNTFHIKNLGEYTDMYLKCDVLLLCDVFEKFRHSSLQYYGLDPAYYITSPGLSWDAMLLYTGVSLDLIHDLEMYELIEKGIRGGLAQCSLRHAEANNKYMAEYDSSKPSTYLIYLDCNNLYGHAMMRKLPMSEFRFLSQSEIKELNIMSVSDNADFGYILEVDMTYPCYLHESHSDLPFAAEKHVPPGGKTAKLIANLYDKFKYVIHYIHLKQCLMNGLILNKIHRVIQFRQDNFLKKYIDLNTQLRQESNSEFEKDFFKLLNNAIFGKTIENRRKQVDIRLVTSWRDTCNKTNRLVGAENLICKPNFKSISIFSENFVAIQLAKEKILLDRPIYIGFSVLEYAKQHLYQFHYNVIKHKYNDKAQLCYTDTDSLLYFIRTDDFYNDLRKNINFYDTSNFETNNIYNIPLLNVKIPGLFKDEMGGDIIKQFIGLRAKLYCIESVKKEIKKAKGVSKHITKKLRPVDYETALINNAKVKCKMNIIKSMKHVLYSQRINKLVLNNSDDKRRILPDHITTLPWGHFKSII